MWKKRDPVQRDPAPSRQIEMKPEPPATPVPRARDRATISRAIVIHGEVRGEEDLVIDGHVDGPVTLGRHAVTVGPEGVVKGSITGQTIAVEGKVEGDLTAEERVVLQQSASVKGDIRAPRVVVQDGAHFKGAVEMGERRRTNGVATAPRNAVQEREPAAAGQLATSESGTAAEASATKK